MTSDGIGQSHLARISLNSTIALTGGVIVRGTVLALQILVLRLIDVESFNLFVAATLVGSIMATVSDLGLSSATVFVSRGDSGLCRSILREVLIRRCVALAVCTVVGAVIVIFVARPSSSYLLVSGAAIVFSYTLASLSQFFRAPLLADGNVALDTGYQVVDRLVSAAISVLGALWGSLLIVAFGQVVGSLVGLFLSLRKCGRLPKVAIAWSRPISRFGLLLSAVTLGSLLHARLDYLVILRWGTADEAAVYAAAYSLFLAASLLPIAAYQAALAYLPSDARASRNYVLIAGLVGLIAGAVIAGFGPWLVMLLYGLSHPDLQTILMILGFAFFFEALNTTIGIFAPIGGREVSLVMIVLTMTVMNLALCLYLIPLYGLPGAAAATLATDILAGVLWMISRRRSIGRESRPPQASIIWAPEVMQGGAHREHVGPYADGRRDRLRLPPSPHQEE